MYACATLGGSARENEGIVLAPVHDCDNAKHNIARNFIGRSSDGTRGKSCEK